MPGFGSWAPLVETTSHDFRRVWETNVLGAMMVARESAKHFVAHNTGNIVNIASTAGQRGYANGIAYSSTKFAVTGLTECWRAELRKNNIRVMQVNPSEVQTNFFETAGQAAREESDEARGKSHRAHDLLDAGDGGSRLHHRSNRVGDESFSC